ncbi:hypothetical protein [Deinococcus arenicola]|uniref:DUF1127 domain-containing protein n=1 Tax=Deinococcus arenicola TaxID=2994950 RepID=A0ABU4DU26_9DEIO|nr:hypothetical protein [Deinococcus sp. ZS9-10]MDV6375931.1 hypothetical protein [Deinococcus sp. ZS9-10]
MSAASGPRSVRRSAKGFRVIRAVRLVTPAPQPGLLRGLWQRLIAALIVTPQQWHAWQTNHRAASGGDGLRALGLSNGHSCLISSPETAPSQRRPTQADLP